MFGLSRRRAKSKVPGTPPRREVKGIRLAILRLLNGLDLVVYALVGVAFVAAAILAFAFSIGQVIFNVLHSFGISFISFQLKASTYTSRSEERRVGKECRSRGSRYR